MAKRKKIGEVLMEAGLVSPSQLENALILQTTKDKPLGKILIELGYVSNRQDIKSLTSADWREHTADAIAQATDRFFMTRLAGSTRGNGQN